MDFIDANKKEEYLKLSPSKRLEWLREFSHTLDRGEALEAVQKMLFELESVELQYNAIEPRQVTNPHQFDVLIRDITESDFSRLGSEIGVARLSPAERMGTFPVTGIVYGSSYRTFVPLVVKKRGISVNLIFLLDTGSPNTYLREDSLEALGFTETIPSDTMVQINGVGLTVYPARGHFENVDLLGQDFFIMSWAVLNINYVTKEVSINRVQAGSA